MRKRPLFIASAVLAAALASTSASAADCSCSLAGDAVAQINSTKGTVFVSGRDGFLPATKGMKISQGMQLVTGADAAARIAFTSGCQANVVANQSLQIVKAADNKLCVKVSDLLTEGQTQYGQVTPAAGAGAGGIIGGIGVQGLVFAGVAAAAIGTAAAVASQSDDNNQQGGGDIGPGPGQISN